MRRSLRVGRRPRPDGESEREVVSQVQCARCGVVYFTSPNGGDPCPSCGYAPPPNSSGTFAPPSALASDEQSSSSGYSFGGGASPSQAEPSGDPRLNDWRAPAQTWPGSQSRPLPMDSRSRPLTGGSSPSYGSYYGPPAPYPGGYAPPPQGQGWYGPPSQGFGQYGQYGQYGPPSQGYGPYAPPSQGQGWYAPPVMSAPPSQYRVGGQVDQWGAPLGPHDAAGMSQPFVYQYFPDGQALPSPAEPSSGLGRLAAVIGVAMVIVIALGMVGIVYFGGPLNKTATIGPTPTPTFGPTPTPTAPPLPSGYTLYIDKNGLYSMGIPSEWTNVTDQASGAASLPSGSGFVAYLDAAQGGLLEIAYTPGSTSDLDALETRFFDSAGSTISGGATVSHVSGPSTVALAGESWTQRSGDITETGYQQTLHVVIIATSHHGHVFMVIYGALQSSFSTMDTNYFQPALATFTFRG